jgi:hypothetical protein
MNHRFRLDAMRAGRAKTAPQHYSQARLRLVWLCATLLAYGNQKLLA